MKKFPYPVILDTDIGDDIDDTWALYYMLASHAFDIRLIVVSNYDTAYKANLVARLLEKAGRTDIPIAVAKATSLPAGYVRGQGGWLGDYTAEKYSGIIDREGYLDRMHETLANARGKVCFFALGTNRTLADYLTIYPQDKPMLQVYAMAGALYKSYEGLTEVVPEFNVASDLAASKVVYESGVDYTMLPLDVCADLRLQGAGYERFLKSESSYAAVIRENYKAWLKDAIFENKNTLEAGSSILFDIVVPWYALHPEKFRVETLPVYVDEKGLTKTGKGMPMHCAVQLSGKDELFRETVEILCKRCPRARHV